MSIIFYIFSIKNSGITTLLAKNNFQLGIYSKMYEILWRKSTPDREIEQLKQMIKHHFLFKIIDAAISLIQEDETIPSEIRAFFHESEKKKIEALAI